MTRFVLATAPLIAGLTTAAQQPSYHSARVIAPDSMTAAPIAPATMPRPAPEMQRLANALTGRWSVRQVFEPRVGMPTGGVGQGTETWRPGPGGRSMIEELHTKVDDREFSGLGIVWWDTQAQGYRVIWCGSGNLRGCVVMSKLALWERDQFVVRDELERGGTHILYREVFSDLRSGSFTQTIYEGASGKELKRTLRIHAVKVASPSP